MAKCVICNSRKGKRKCIAEEGFICSLCCGETRSAEKCEGCSFVKGTEIIKNYQKVPHIALSIMKQSFLLQDNSDIIESAICRFDLENERTLDDNIIIRFIELLLDKYYFNELELKFQNRLEEEGFNFIDQVIQKDIKGISTEELAKLLATIYRSVKRHTYGKREYIQFIHQFVGALAGKGIKVIPDYLSGI